MRAQVIGHMCEALANSAEQGIGEYATALELLEALAGAGFAIVPKSLTPAMDEAMRNAPHSTYDTWKAAVAKAGI